MPIFLGVFGIGIFLFFFYWNSNIQAIHLNHSVFVKVTLNFDYMTASMRGSKGGWAGGPDPPPLKNYKNIGFLSNSGPDPLKNHNAPEPAFNVGPSSVCQRNNHLRGISLRADDGPLIVVFGSSHPSSTTLKKEHLSWAPSDKIFWIRA